MTKTIRPMLTLFAAALFVSALGAATDARAQSTFSSGPSATTIPTPPSYTPPPTVRQPDPPMQMRTAPERMPDMRVPGPVTLRETQTVLPRRAVRNHLENRSANAMPMMASTKAAESKPAARQLLESAQPIF